MANERFDLDAITQKPLIIELGGKEYQVPPLNVDGFFELMDVAQKGDIMRTRETIDRLAPALSDVLGSLQVRQLEGLLYKLIEYSTAGDAQSEKELKDSTTGDTQEKKD